MTTDTLHRPLRSLRVSVTDRCNLRCTYCMPEPDYVWLPRDDLLRFGEVARLVAVCQRLGVTRVRLTGGEPLVRSDLESLVRRLAAVDGIDDLALTTNAVLMEAQAPALRAAGLQRITVSLDTLRPERFRRLAGRDDLARVLAGVEAARRAGFTALKINTVVMRGGNDDELLELLEYAADIGAELRFIEYMDVGGATGWSWNRVVSRDEILAAVGGRFGAVESLGGRGSAPADRFRLPGGQVFGIIASTTQPFCRTCDRARLTADGKLFTCLYGRQGTDLRQPLREGASDAELEQLIAGVWSRRDDRGAERRRELLARGPLAAAGELRGDPHLEMHTRGG